MKRCKRFAVLATATAIIMICSIAPTFSWLSAQSGKVINTFAGGTIAITLDEAQVDTEGKSLDNGVRVTENVYKYTAGVVLDKDPTPTVLKGSDSCYVFIYVENELGELFSLDYQTDYWTQVASSDEGTLYIYKDIIDTSSSDEDMTLNPIFTHITVSEELTAEDVEQLGEKTVEITAYAVQSKGVSEEDAITLATAQFITAEADAA